MPQSTLGGPGSTSPWSSPPVPLSTMWRGGTRDYPFVPPLRIAERGTGGEDPKGEGIKGGENPTGQWIKGVRTNTGNGGPTEFSLWRPRRILPSPQHALPL